MYNRRLIARRNAHSTHFESKWIWAASAMSDQPKTGETRRGEARRRGQAGQGQAIAQAKAIQNAAQPLIGANYHPLSCWTKDAY